MIGQRVGNYLIEKELGKGGMGAVYVARHAVLERPAAVKILLPEFTATPEIVKRFLNEAKAASAIRHPGIVEIYDFGVFGENTAFIAMELLDGESLGTRLRRESIGTRASLQIIRQICGALGAAHALGIVHRDLKPENVYIVPDPDVPGGERIKLLDFGIAKVSSSNATWVGGPGEKTRTGSIMGTPAYMAPEQCRGVAIDHRADLYALGCILFEMFTGRPPFTGEGAGDVLAAHIMQPAPSVTTLAPSVPSAVARIVEQLLAKNPAERIATTTTLANRIESVLESEPAIESGPTAPRMISEAAAVATTLSGSAVTTDQPPPKRARTTSIVLGGGVLLAGIAAIVLANRSGAPETATVVVPPDGPPVIPDAQPVALPVVVDASRTIHVSIDSVPSHSQLLLDGKPIGTTPFSDLMPADDRSLVFVVRRDGYLDGRLERRATTDIDEKLELESRRRPPTGRGSARPTGSDTPAGSGTQKGSGFGEDDGVNPLRPHGR